MYVTYHMGKGLKSCKKVSRFILISDNYLLKDYCFIQFQLYFIVNIFYLSRDFNSFIFKGTYFSTFILQPIYFIDLSNHWAILPPVMDLISPYWHKRKQKKRCTEANRKKFERKTKEKKCFFLPFFETCNFLCIRKRAKPVFFAFIWNQSYKRNSDLKLK